MLFHEVISARLPCRCRVSTHASLPLKSSIYRRTIMRAPISRLTRDAALHHDAAKLRSVANITLAACVRRKVFGRLINCARG